MRWLAILLIGGYVQAQQKESLLPVTTDIVQALIAKRVEPRYAADVVKTGVSGDVLVSVEIDKKGRLRRFTFVSGPGEPRESIAKALYDWRFKPYRVNGTDVPIKSELTFHFSGQQPAQDPSAAFTPTVVKPGIPNGAPIVPPDEAREMLLRPVRPEYPQVAKQGRIQGAVFLNAVIGTNGQVERLQILSGPNQLRQAAFDAVRLWTFQPLIQDGQPVTFITEVEVNFAIQ